MRPTRRLPRLATLGCAVALAVACAACGESQPNDVIWPPAGQPDVFNNYKTFHKDLAWKDGKVAPGEDQIYIGSLDGAADRIDIWAMKTLTDANWITLTIGMSGGLCASVSFAVCETPGITRWTQCQTAGHSVNATVCGQRTFAPFAIGVDRMFAVSVAGPSQCVGGWCFPVSTPATYWVIAGAP